MALESISVVESIKSLKELHISGCHRLQQSSIAVELRLRPGLKFQMQAYTDEALNYPENFIFDLEEDDDDSSY